MLESLNAHRAWANRRVLEWCFAAPANGSGPDDYCVKMMSHVLFGESAWLDRLDGVADPAVRERLLGWELLTGGQAADLLSVNEAAWKKVMASDLDRKLTYKRFNGDACESTVAEIVTHACTHGMYHRGQIAAQAARLGLKVPSTDFIVFARA